MPAPMVAAIEALDKVLTEAVNNSKIANTIDKEIGKALGLLVDLILLPFLPLLVGGIIQLYMAVLTFGKWWDAAIAKIKEKGILGLLEMTLDIIKATNVFLWIWEFIRIMMFGTEEEKKKQLEFTMNLSKILWGLFEWLLTPLLSWAFGAGQEVRKQLEITIAPLVNFINDIVTAILRYVFGIEGGKKAKESMDFWVKVSTLLNPVQWLIDVVNFMFGNKQALINDLTLIVNLKKGVVDPIVNSALSAVGGAVDFAKGILGWKAEGGYINETGPYVLHKGETVIPAGQSGGGMTVNIYGTYQNDEDLYRKFIDRLRTDQWRQNV